MADAPPFELYRLDREMPRAEVIAALASMPGRVRSTVSGLGASGFTARGAEGDWTAMETLRHFRDIMQVYGMRFKWIILQDAPLLANYDENAWAASSPDGPAEIAAMLDEMDAYRAETVRLLRSLDDAGWRRTGRHEALGVVELEPYVRHELAHEERHLAQLMQALTELH
jgi:hypothetical protein